MNDNRELVYVAGHRGLAGSAIARAIEKRGKQEWIGRTRAELDLTNRDAVFEFMKETKPDAVVVAAAKVGGIGANDAFPVEFLTENLQIQSNLLDAAHEVAVPHLLFLGSSCIYPKFADQPIHESSLLTGPLEPTNDAYAIAKIAGIRLVDAYRSQYGHHWISAMPTNLYGIGDNFDLESSHVLPALIRRFHEAAESGVANVTLWGSGVALREFLYVDDLADACLFLLENYDESGPINVGFGEEISVRDLATKIAEVVGYRGTISWDGLHPDGTPRKLLDSSRIRAAGWAPSVGLAEGIQLTFEWFKATQTPSAGPAN
ncbi:MAG TPA: GDP-L-fucose synthase [Terrimesophilobacter sp.]|nr:GDP-L-fucose synthase [Terrimesophilobacter sp.]